MDSPVRGSEHADRCHFTTTTTGAMATGHGIVIIVIEDQAFTVTTRLDCAVGKTGGCVWHLAEELEVLAHLCL